MQRRYTLDAKRFGVAVESTRPRGGLAAMFSLPLVDRHDMARPDR